MLVYKNHILHETIYEVTPENILTDFILFFPISLVQWFSNYEYLWLTISTNKSFITETNI